MLEQIQGDDPIDSKAVMVEDNNVGMQFPMIVTVFDEEDNEVLDKSGFRGRYALVNLIEGSIQDSFTDVHSIDLEVMTDDAAAAIHDIIRGWETHADIGVSWAELEHGGVYQALDIRQMAQGDGS